MIRLKTCERCGEQFRAERLTARYCGPTCRKVASRADDPATTGDREVCALLKRLGLAAKVWPVYRWDSSPPVFALMVPRAVALAELNARLPAPITDAALARALKDGRIAEGPVERQLIADFYAMRRDRKLAA